MEYLWHGYVPFVVITIWSFPFSWLITGFVARVTRRVEHVEQELITRAPGFSGVRVAQSLVFCVMLCRKLFVLFQLAIMLSVLRFTASDNLFGILKIFFLFIEGRKDNGA